MFNVFSPLIIIIKITGFVLFVRDYLAASGQYHLKVYFEFYTVCTVLHSSFANLAKLYHCLVQFVAQRLNLLHCSLVKSGVTLGKTSYLVFILTLKVDRKELAWTDAYARSHQRAVLRGN